MRVNPHAEAQAKMRNIPIEDIVAIAQERLAKARLNPQNTEVAILVGYTDDGWQGASNGNVVWAIIRFGQLVTTMFRREDQPSTPQALRVREVIA